MYMKNDFYFMIYNLSENLKKKKKSKKNQLSGPRIKVNRQGERVLRAGFGNNWIL